MTPKEPQPPKRRPGLRTEAVTLGRTFVRFGPSPRRLPLATQAGVAMAAPVVLLSLLGREDLGLLAATGAFTVVYGGRLSTRERAAFLPIVAAALFACAGLGVLAASLGPAVVIAGLMLVAVASSVVCFGWSVGPPGPLFFVLVFGLSAHLAHIVEPGLYLAVYAASCAFAYAVSLVPLVKPSHRRTPARPLRDLFPGPRFDPPARTLLVRAIVVAVAGGVVAAVLDPERAYWVISAGLAVLGAATSRRVTLTRGIHRAAGTVVGGGIYLLLALLALPGVVLGLILGALQFLIELVVVRHYALALALVTPLVLLIIGATGPGGMPLAIERVVDTIAGSLVGVIAGFIVLPARRA